MSSGVWVAGGGVISGIGMNLSECINSFEAMQPGMQEMEFLKSIHHDTYPVAEVKASNDTLASMADESIHWSRTALLSKIAAKEAWQNSGLGDISNYRVGFVSASTVGGMDLTEHFMEEYLQDNSRGKLRNVIHHDCGSITDLVAESLGVQDFISTISTACSSGANAMMYASRLIKNDMLDVVIAGGADSLTRFTLNGFNTLMILDTEPCKPFDENRRGLNLGEGAAYLVLVSDKIAAEIDPWCRLSGYANANDAYHQTASSSEGTGNYLAMNEALQKAGIEASDVDYINLHGTGTANNDSSEGKAIMKLFGNNIPPLSSTKSFTGHTLAASGALEAVFSAYALKEGILYPNAHFQTQMSEISFSPLTEFLSNQDLQHVMSNSFGFGGNCSSLIFSKDF
ncbi:MAG: beta-ketoacyl-[acyl-carrier-protein] synthase family protein [Saprospiraceae bacterium]|nr:beta-ketoacyl-[acyl-carrier-protein] synthase family protein [Saprospiraceae bacterium]